MAVLTLSVSHGGAKNSLAALEPLMGRLIALFWQAYRVAPALTVGIILAVALPVVSALIRLSKPLTRSKDATRLYKPKPGRTEHFDANIGQVSTRRRRQPFIEIENGRGMRCAIPRDMLRIGREDDNDIRIPSRYVHRYHAAIHREDYDDWRITDLTGVESNGVIVNGKRCCEARLSDGDLIQLGPGKLRFRAGAG
ncbi:MAG TPA: FHA domain-containing protein [Hyphomicrobium sp.]|nr:FHA domain-containing protein [Hyphomicrobium sp.]